METLKEDGWTNRSNPRIPHHRLHVLENGAGKRTASLVLRKMETRGGCGIVVRELWPEGDQAPQEFGSDRELTEAMQQRGLPILDHLERVRRSVAATQLPN